MNGRTAVIVAFSFLVVWGAVGCFKVKLEAPPRSGKYLLGSSQQPSAVRVKRRCWYLFWGLLPVSGNSTADVVKNLPPGYRIVKVQSSFDATSFFISLFTVGLVGSSVLVVEGVAPLVPPSENMVKMPAEDGNGKSK